MPNPCYYYRKESLRYVIELSIGYYAFYIQLKLRCSYVFSNTRRGKIKRKKKRNQALLLRAKVEALRANAKAAQLRLKLNKLEGKQFARKRKEINTTKELEQLERAASLYTLKAVNYTTNPILDPRLQANFSQLQNNFTSFINSSFFNALFLFPTQDFAIKGSLYKSS